MAVLNTLSITGLQDATLHPPALSTDVEADGAAELPWVLLEKQAYVSDRSNATTACLYTKCGKQIQVTLCVQRPPRVSYLCVFCRGGRSQERAEEIMFGYEPDIITTQGNLVLLRMKLGTRGRLDYEVDLYIYRPGGPEGPSLALLKRPPGDRIFCSSEIGLLRCPINRGDGHDGSSSGTVSYLRPHVALQDKSYMVAALCRDRYNPEASRFILYLYNSKQDTWTMTTVLVDEQQLQQYQHACSMHLNTKVITIGGEDETIGFVDLWRGILLCDLCHVQDNPRLRYIPLPEKLLPVEPFEDEEDARLTRDIAVVKGRIKCVQQRYYMSEGLLVVTSWSRTSLLEDTWQVDYEIESSSLNVNTPQFQLLPKTQAQGDVLVPPFKGLTIMQPTLSLQEGDATVYFMVKVNYDDVKAWVIAVDMKENKVQGVVEFDAERYVAVGFSYLHSRISKYLKSPSGATKGNLKRRGMLQQGPINKKQPPAWLAGHFLAQKDAEREDEDKMFLD